MVTRKRAPIALFVFSRPDLTIQILKLLEEYDCSEICVYSDGPRENHPEDQIKVSEVRAALEGSPLRGRMTIVSQEENLGLMRHFRFGLQHFFARHSAGIVLEDDCHPCGDFFEFCNWGLQAFEQDPKIGMVQGSSFLPGWARRFGDHYQSKRLKIWGWATWASNMSGFDPDLSDWVRGSKSERRKELRSRGLSAFQAARQERVLSRAMVLGTWDIQFTSHLGFLKKSALSPTSNLVVNQGFREDATHTRWGSFSIPATTGSFFGTRQVSRALWPLLEILEPLNRIFKSMSFSFRRPRQFGMQVKQVIVSRLVENKEQDSKQ